MDLEGMGVARLLSDAAPGAASPVLAGAGQVGTLSCVSCPRISLRLLARIALRARRARAAHRHDDGSGSRGLMDAPVPAWIEYILSRWIPCGGTTSSRPVGRRQRRKRARRWK